MNEGSMTVRGSLVTPRTTAPFASDRPYLGKFWSLPSSEDDEDDAASSNLFTKELRLSTSIAESGRAFAKGSKAPGEKNATEVGSTRAFHVTDLGYL
jgi:hypothetical protein